MLAALGLLKRGTLRQAPRPAMLLCTHNRPGVSDRQRPAWGANAPRVFTASAPVRAQAAVAAAPAEKATKKPPTAYNLFVSAKYPPLKAKDPATTLGSMSKLWKEASPADQSRCKAPAAI